MRNSPTSVAVYGGKRVRSAGSPPNSKTTKFISAASSSFGSGDLATKLHDLLNQPTGLSDLSGDPAIQSIFDHSLHWTFWGVVVVAVLTFVTTWLIPVSREAGRRGPKVDAQEAMSH